MSLGSTELVRRREEFTVRIAGCIALAVTMIVATQTAFADDPGYTPGPWHFRAVSCVDSTVRSVTPRLGRPGQTSFTARDFAASGVIVTYATSLGLVPLFPSGNAVIVHYAGDAGNDAMTAERAGDRVQVCFLGGPAPTQFCNPDKDARGRRYRVYDVRQQRQYWGMNSEHDCGGA